MLDISSKKRLNVSMPAVVFSIVSQKYGEGKTTTAVNLSVSLAKKGVRALLIDFDQAGSATKGLGYASEKNGSLYDILHGAYDFDRSLKKTRYENLAIVPSDDNLEAIETELRASGDYLMLIRESVCRIRDSGDFDAIILDCPPVGKSFAIDIIGSADRLLVTLRSEYTAIEVMSQISQAVEDLKARDLNKTLGIGGIIMTMFDIKTDLSAKVLEDIKIQFKGLPFETVIPRSSRLGEAASFGQSIFEYDEMSSGAQAYDRLGMEIIKRFKLI
ncbi:MAG: ParA family protein [Puniceicoccales bacterium]|jgi:chromosome partitioning protein|nr:ParA family protein [Puniceicoccales bacterium]